MLHSPSTLAPPSRALALFAPTASGKSRLALTLARKLKTANITTHIVNCDALQLYNRLPILTAQPRAADKAQTPHHLYGVVSSTQRFSAGLYAARASRLLAKLECDKPRSAVILCGGSGLYLKALLEGLTALPQPSLDAVLRVRGWQEQDEDLYLLLQQRDPHTAETLAPRDRHRIVRALEFYETCGESLGHVLGHVRGQVSAQKQEQERKSMRSFVPQERPFVVALMPDRQTLYEAINARFERMLQQGAIEEVRALNEEAPLPLDSPLRGTLGLREIQAYCKGTLSWQLMVAQAQQRARNYAKRQMTWMRHQLRSDAVLPHLMHEQKGHEKNHEENYEEDYEEICERISHIWHSANSSRQV